LRDTNIAQNAAKARRRIPKAVLTRRKTYGPEFEPTVTAEEIEQVKQIVRRALETVRLATFHRRASRTHQGLQSPRHE
jgi:hypothetical protein